MLQVGLLQSKGKHVVVLNGCRGNIKGCVPI